MSNEWKGYYGKDGKRYKDVVELWNANAVVENQEEQTRLLQVNAELAAFQAEQEERKMQQAEILEYSRQEHEKQMQQTKYEHEQELLLLKIFDEVSIPIEIYKKFEKQLFNAGSINSEDVEQYSKLMTHLLNKKAEDGNKFRELLESNMKFPNNEVKYTDKYKKFEEFINEKYSKTMFNIEQKDFDIVENNTEFIDVLTKEKKKVNQSKKIVKFSGIFEIVIGIGILLSELNHPVMFILSIITLVMGLFFTSFNRVYDSNTTKELKIKLNKSINNQMAKEYTTNVSEEEQTIQNKISEVQAKLRAESKEIIDKRLQDLYNFRINHYNIKIEKLFYDVGLINKCTERNYNWLNISKDNIKHEGTYEDYFHYFNDYNPNNEEPQGE